MRAPKVLLWFCILLFFVPPTFADTVILKNGNRVTGIVVEASEERVILQFDQDATVTFSREEVEEVVYTTEEERKTLLAEWEKKPKIPPQAALPTFPRHVAKAPPLTPTKENQMLLSEGEWAVRKSQHFVVYYQNLTHGKAVADRAEYNLEKILGDLNLRRVEGEKRKFTVFVIGEESQWRQFLTKLGIQPELTGGFTTGAQTQEIFLYSLSIPYLQLAFPHELTHILLEDVAKGRKIPLWLGEGFANYEGGIIGIDEELLMEAAREETLFPLPDLVSRMIYPADPEQRTLFYTQSEKLVEYLISQQGRRRFGEFLEHLLNTQDMEQAIRVVYGGKIRDLAHLQELWLRYLTE